MHAARSNFALVLLDFLPSPLNALGDRAASVLDHTSAALAFARSEGLTVAHVGLGFEPADYAAIPERNKVFGGVRGSQRFAVGGEESTFVERMAPDTDEIVVRKTRFGAFSTTDLATRLREAGVEHLVLAGQSTSGVVLSTVREAADLDFGLVVLADAGGDPDDQLHTFLMDKVIARQADVVASSDLPNRLGQR